MKIEEIRIGGLVKHSEYGKGIPLNYGKEENYVDVRFGDLKVRAVLADDLEHFSDSK